MNTNTTTRIRQPIAGVMRREALTLVWLGRRTGFHPTYLSRVFNGFEPATATVRSRCARALDMPEGVLFHGDGASGASRPEGNSADGSDTQDDGTALGLPAYAAAGGAA